MNSCFIFLRFEVETQRKESTVETATDSNPKRSASRKRTYLGIAVALVVVVGVAGVAISANGGQDKSQRSGATVTGKKGSAVTITNISGVEILVTELRTGTRKVLHSCIGPKVASFSSMPADKAFSHEVGVSPVMRQTDINGCTVQFERSVGGQIDDLRLEHRFCGTAEPYQDGYIGSGACIYSYPLIIEFQSAGIIGPAQRNVVQDARYVMNGNSNFYSGVASIRQPDSTVLGYDLTYIGQRANNGKYMYSMTLKDVDSNQYRGSL